MIVKVQFFINLADFGWSETYYAEAAATNVEEFYTRARQLAGQINRRCGVGAGVKGIRISDVARPHITSVSGSSGITSTTDENQAGVPWGAAEVIMTNPNGYHRTMLLRGSPFFPSKMTERSLFTSQWRSSYTPWRDALTTSANNPTVWGIYAYDQGNVLNGKTKILTLSAEETTLFYSFTVADVTPFSVGQLVRVHGGRGIGTRQLKGLTRILSINTGTKTITVEKRDTDFAAPIYLGGGYIRGAIKAVVPISFIEPQRWVVRKTNGAFFVTAGARPRQKNF